MRELIRRILPKGRKKPRLAVACIIAVAIATAFTGSALASSSGGQAEMFTGMSSLQEVTLGEEFAFDASDSTSFLPEVEIDGISGLWYNLAGEGFAPGDVPSNTADTYTAGTEEEKTAFAVYSQDDGTLTFYKTSSIPEAGETYEGKEATAVYTGIEESKYNSAGLSPWYSYKNDITSAIVKNTISPKSTSYWFYGLSSCTSIDLSRLDTSNVSDMSDMFYKCSSLTSLDVSGFDTSNVAIMMYMFYDCSSLTSLDLSGFNTSNVISMEYMFAGCSALASLDVSGFDTSAVTDMTHLFSTCGSLTSLNISSFDTSSVEDMSYMFRGCSGLTSLNVSSFDTSSVEDMSYMFSGCSALTSLDVSGFITSGVEDMSYMFSGCSALVSLDLSDFDTSSVEEVMYMFSRCSALTSLNLSGFDTSGVTDMRRLFQDCSSLTTLDLSSFDTSSATEMGYMFLDCDHLATIYVSSLWNTDSVTGSTEMFYNCSSLVGCAGTEYDNTHTDVLYAHVDSASDPGYLSYR